MPRGGKRVGAGRKKRTASVLPFTGDVRAVGGGEGRRSGKSAPVAPPKGVLTREEYRVWLRLAPAAQARGTLAPQTAHGFALLCQLVVQRDELKARLDEDGWTFVNQFGERKRHALWSTWQYTTLRVEQNLARFGLTSDGRGAAAPAAAEQANPWAVIAKR